MIDINRQISNFQIGFILGFSELRIKYRRTRLGIIWHPLMLLVSIIAITLIFSRLWERTISEFLPIMAVSMACWQFISTTVVESCQTLRSRREDILSGAWTLAEVNACFFMRKNIECGINLCLAIPIAIFFGGVFPQPIALISALPLAFFSIYLLQLFLSLISMRFNDLEPLLLASSNIAFLVTPVFWEKVQLGSWGWIQNFNPYFHFLELIRNPLLGSYPSLISYIFAMTLSLVLFIALKVTRLKQKATLWI